MIQSTGLQNLTILASAIPEIMVGAHENLNGSRDLFTPLSGMVCHPRLALATANEI